MTGVDAPDPDAGTPGHSSAEHLALRAFFEGPEAWRGVLEVFDNDARILVTNGAAASFAGVPASELAGRGIRALVTDGVVVDRFVQRCRDAAASGGERFEEVVEWANGETRTLRVTVRPLDPGSRGALVAVTAEDITESTSESHRLRRSARSFHLLVKNLAGAVYQRRPDATWTLEFISDGSYAVCGYRPADLVGDTAVVQMANLIHPQDVAAVVEQAERAFAARQEFTAEYRILHSDGTEHWVWDRAQGVYDDDGVLLGVEGILTDITERRREADERAQLLQQLLHAQRVDSVGRLAGGVAHDFNNLLAVVLGHADLIRTELPPDSPLIEYLDEIRSAADRSVHLTRQLLGYARRQPTSPREVNLNEAIPSAINMLRRLIGERIEVAWRPGAVVWPVMIDPTQVDQVLTNLCLNSRDAIHGTGRITIATRNVRLDDAFVSTHRGARVGEFVELLVADTGCGMDNHVLAHLFDPFFTTKEPGKGTGLGMATVYGIVKQNRGYVGVETAVGSGTAIRIYFERYRAPVDRPPAVEPVAPMPRGSETVLLVEDEPALLKIGTRILEGVGYRVLAAGSPTDAAALAAVHGKSIDLLVTDVIMPTMNGRDLADHLRADFPQLEVLFMSGYADTAFDGAEPDAVHYIAKPFTAGAFASKVRAVLDGSKRQRGNGGA